MSRLFHLTLIVLTVISIPLLGFYILTSIFMSPVGGGLGLLLGAIYTLLWIIVLRSSAAWPRAGWWWIVASLLWGAGVSFLIVMATGLPIFNLMEKLGWTFTFASWGGAYPEEIAKAVGVAVILLSFRRLNRPWHGFIIGGMVGLGFEVFENLLYGSFGAVLDANSDLNGVFFTWFYRGVIGPGLHVVFSATAGWGVGLALFMAGRSAWWRWGVAVFWTFLAFAFHFGWNLMWGSSTAQGISMIVVALLMYPVFIYLYVRCHRAAKHDDTQVVLPEMITSLAGLEAYRRSLGPGFDVTRAPGVRAR
ncbi:PrsW family intramembrane metalloprotease [Corynebacterium sp. A21]|uniref:PrsW family intramembrane metalloprotease n=1 Tax=Corynebacterium sp. A21 TaxID=3457318 RepID=UPI003FD2E6D1